MKKKFLALTLTLTCATIAASFGVTATLIKAEEGNVSSTVIADTYAFGSTLVIDSSVVIDYGDAKLPVENAYLTNPLGNTSKGKRFTLDQYGKYELTLEGSYQGAKVSSKKSFSVKKDFYSVTNSDSTIDYGSLNPNFVSQGYSNGLKLSLAEGDTFTYNKPINIYEKSLTSILYWNCIEIDPHVQYVTTRVTDAYDSSNYFEIVWHRGSIYYECWVGASVKGSSVVGIESDEAGSIEVGDHHYSKSIYGGTWIHANNKINGSYVNVNYELDTSDRKNIKIYAETDTTRQRYLISEINNEKIFDNHFDGFTTGDVYISLNASTFNGTTYAPIEIASLAGLTGEALLPMDFYEDKKAPIFIFDNHFDGSQIVGGVPLSIPMPTVLDDSALNGQFEASVYYGYGTNSERLVNLNNGVFTPDALGVYTIVYEATDIYGNKGTRTLDLYCGEAGRTGIDFKVNPLNNVYAGSTVNFSDYSIRSRNGEASVSVVVTAPDGAVSSLSSPSQSYLIDQVGEYIVEYLYSDILYSGETSYVFESISSGKSMFSSSSIVGLSEYYLSNFTYSIDEVPAYSYNSGRKERVEISAYASYDDGEYESIDYNSFKIKAGTSSVKFKFAIKNDPSIYIESGTKKVVSVNNDGVLDITKYFQGDFNGVATNEKIEYTPSTSGDLSLDYVNRILWSAFRFDFSFSSSLASALTLRLTDYYDSDNVLVITLFANGQYSINGGVKKTLSAWTDKKTSITYNADKSKLYIGETTIDLDSPFSHDLCNMSLEFSDASTSGRFGVYQLCNQPLDSTVTRDKVSPVYSAIMPPTIAEIGDQITLSRLYFSDVLSPSPDSSALMSAYYSTDEENIPLVDKNGVSLVGISDFSSDHVVDIDRFGYYLVSYTCEDGKGNRVYGGISQGVTVTDNIAPTMRFASYDGKVINVNANSAFTPLEVVVSDNVTSMEDIEVWYMAYDTDQRLLATVSKGQEMTLPNKGRYTIYVLAYDEAGNSAILSYQVQAN